MQSSFSANSDVFRLAVVGDLHTHWDAADLRQFAIADYDLLFFTGDLGGGTQESSLRVARSMAQLSTPALVMPGNNDTDSIIRLEAELAHQRGIGLLSAIAGNRERRNQSIALCGYSEHRLIIGQREISLIAGRPHSMGGPELSFPEFMSENYGVDNLTQSTERIKSLVDSAAQQLIFISHNGPKGLGDRENDMWGCDFKDNGGDWGDPDLALALDYAKESGKQVLAVIAGHMHLRTKQGEERAWQREVDEKLYINAARVPRIFSDKSNVYRHHVAVTIDEYDLSVEEVLVPEYQ